METSKLRKFAQFARKSLIEQVGTRMQTVLAEGSLARKESEKAVAELEKKIKELAGDDGKKAGERRIIEMVAYTWFNRFCALRYMEVNRYTQIGLVSPADGQFQPEILAEAKMGHINEEMIPQKTREKVNRLLDESDPSDDPQGEAYRLLLVAACNHFHSLMPFMFEKIADYTELLLPDDLLSGNSILAYTREALLPINCSPEHTDESVEVIGWLYQFYISEKKDEVFAALKKGKKITSENIPAATQLFTPHWIVRYLVENSLGRLWMLNNPNSKLVERMEYYIKPEEPETDFLKISSPEEIKICDPACGSGHMLTYAFELLYAIYEEQGYQVSDIPQLILEKNLYGIEIDQRAGALAAFALTMKAREKYRRFLTPGKVVQPNICVLENISIDPADLSAYTGKVGRDLFSGGLQGVVNQWEEADNFGSLIRPLVTDVSEVLELLRERQMGENLFLASVHQKVLKALRQADYLSPKYHVVVANPPYMGQKGMNTNLKSWLGQNYQNSKHDLFAAFIERNREFTQCGYVAMITMQVWMFLAFFEKLRLALLDSNTFCTMAHLGPNAFDSIGGEVVSTTAFVFRTAVKKEFDGLYFRLTDGKSESEKDTDLQDAIRDRSNELRHLASAIDFSKIPGSSIAYWCDPKSLNAFCDFQPLRTKYEARVGLQSNDNDRFLRYWFEVSADKIGFGCADNEAATASRKKWFPYHKGGSFRRWYGNHEYVVNWENGGKEVIALASEIYGSPSRTVRSKEFYFRPGFTWSTLSTGAFAVRNSSGGFMFDIKGSCIFPLGNNEPELHVLGLLNSSVVNRLLSFTAPTLDYSTGAIESIPIPELSTALSDELKTSTEKAIALAKQDWDSDETSWDFSKRRVLDYRTLQLDEAFRDCNSRENQLARSLADEERLIDRLASQAYGFPAGEKAGEFMTHDCNEWSQLEGYAVVSYAVGCMLGRYSLDKPGLILANQGETADYYRQQIPKPTFEPDEDNVIPLLDGDWFEDDITERFKAFLKVTFGTEYYEENLTFLENSLYPENASARKRKTIRDYFLKEFYNHHIKLYKKRPIYWLFSSPKGTFNALIYMHRYRPDTVSTVLQYLRDFRDKLSHRRDHLQAVADSGSASQSDQTRALKEVATLKKQLKELEDYEAETLFPLAQKRIEIDLDNGVKQNYPLFGKALKKVPGLSGN